MTRIEEELKSAKLFYIATIDGDSPRVRPFSSITSYEGHTYICSGRRKEFFKQVSENPNIEICAMKDNGEWIRVSATLKIDNRVEPQEAMLNDPTGPSQLYTPNDGNFVVFQLTNIKALKFNFYAAPIEIKEND